MKLLAQIKKDRMTAKRAKQQVPAKILTVLVGELETMAKRGEVNDSDIIKLCKKFIASNDEVIEACGTYDSEDVPSAVVEAKRENSVLRLYLPKQLNDVELRDIISDFAYECGIDRPLRGAAIGKVMGYLKNNYAGQYDGKKASQIVRTL